MSFAGFSITASALAAYQAAENVVANNIANVNTPGASAQVAILAPSRPITSDPAQYSQTKPGTQGTGVEFLSIKRLHDNSLDTLYRGANSSQNYYTAQDSALTTLQSALNEPSGGVSAAFTTFQSSIGQLASQTSGSNSDATNRQAVLKAAQAFATSLNGAANAISTQETNVKVNAQSAVDQANGLIEKIGVLNGAIRASSAAGDNPNTFLDQRDYLVDQLSEIVPVQTTVVNNGSTLITVGGLAVVNDTTTYKLNSPVVVTGADGTPQLVVGRTNDPPGNPIVVPLGNGRLGGLIDLYNNGLSKYKDQIDAFASTAASEFNQINTAGYDQFGQQGKPIFASNVLGQTIGAADITVALSSTSQIAATTASTAAGTLTQRINASNTTVNTTTVLNGNPIVANAPPAGGTTGTLTIDVDGLTKTYNYDTAGPDATIGGFVNRFNALNYGITASFDQTAQEIVFNRDPANESQAFQATTGYTPTAAFTLTDSNVPGAAQPAVGSPAAGLLDALGAGRISGVQQNSTNAFGANGNTNSIAMRNLFTRNVGAPPVTNHAVAGFAAGQQVVQLTAALGNLTVGQSLTIDPGTPSEENVLVTAINDAVSPQTFTATFANAHAAGTSIVATRKQTLGDFYGNAITQIGFDAQAAATGTTTQTNLASTLATQRSNSNGINIDQETQNLIQYQTAYTAAAKTFTVLQSLLATIMQTI